MGKSKFTPGPWEYDEHGQFIHKNGDLSRRIADIRGYGWLSLVKGMEPAAKELNSNAALIAAAPDLYEALEKIATKSLPNPAPGQKIIKLAEVALAKARGEK